MDFKKLSKVTDATLNGVVKPQAPKGLKVAAEVSPLDALQTQSRIPDSAPTIKEKLLIIDSDFIKRFNASSRDKRRSFLAKLSDSARRKVLAEVKRIKDAEVMQDQGKDLAHLLLDQLMGNQLAAPTAENSKALTDFANKNEYCDFDSQVRSLAQKIASGEKPTAEDVDLMNQYTNGSSQLSSAEDITSSSDDNMPQMPEVGEVDDTDRQFFGDAAKKNLKSLLTSLSLSNFIKDGDAAIGKAIDRNHNFCDSYDEYWSAVDKAFKEQFSPENDFEPVCPVEGDKVVNPMINPDGDGEKVKNEPRTIMDDHNDPTEEEANDVDVKESLDTIEENPFIDENGEKMLDTEDTPMLKLLAEALKEYASGNEEKLQELCSNTINQQEQTPEDPTEEEPVEEPTDEEGAEDLNDEPMPEESYNERPGLQVEDKDRYRVHDCAKYLLARDPRANEILDSLPLKITRQYNFKISDCGCPFCEPCMQVQVMEIPLSEEEFCSVCPPQAPDYFNMLLQSLDEPQCPCVQSCCTEGNCLNVNNGQMYYPCEGSTAEEISKRIDEAVESGKQEILGSCTRTLDSAMKLASKLNLLNLIDSRFYKTSLASNEWHFNRVPDCLKAHTNKAGVLIKDSDGTINLFGTTFKLK